MSDETRKVGGYPYPPQTRERIKTETYEYHMPFNYPNIAVDLRYLRGQEFHGVEMNPVNAIGAEMNHHPADTITIVEDDPIVRVAVIGSACTPPGFVTLEAEPIPEFYKPVDVSQTAALRFREDNLWGMHQRSDNWLAVAEAPIKDFEGRVYDEIPQARKELKPNLGKYRMKTHYRENPLVGMSCAIFEIPKSRKIIISGGSDVITWTTDNYPTDNHYSFRTIRVTLAVAD